MDKKSARIKKQRTAAVREKPELSVAAHDKERGYADGECVGARLRESQKHAPADGLPAPLLVCPPGDDCPVCTDLQHKRVTGGLEN